MGGADAVRVARGKLRALDPITIAASAGAVFSGSVDGGEFTLCFFGDDVRIVWPAFELASGMPPLPDHVLALLLFYLSGSDGTEPTGRLISFAELPDARFYVQAFRGYTGAALVRAFGDDPSALGDAVARVGGVALDGMADRAWSIEALPRVPVTLVWWDADDEFDARAEILFDSTASHHLTTDGCAVLGSWLTAMLRG